MRFLHTADLHFGSSSRILPNNLNLKRQEIAYDEIYEIAEKNNIKVIVSAGDLIHRKDPDRPTRDLILRKVLEYDKKGFRTILLEGNHDSVDAKASNIHFLSLLHKAGKLKNTMVVELQNKIVSYADGAFIIMPVFSEIELQKMINRLEGKEYKWIVCILHTDISGAISDTGYPLKKGWDLKRVKNIDRINYYALGHIHRYQRVNLPNCFFSGAPIQHNFGDTLPKGVLIVDTDDPNNPEFVALKKPEPFFLIRNGEQIPDNGYIKLLTNRSLLGVKLPANVVATAKDLSDIDIKEYDGELDPIKRLPEFLAKEGLTQEELDIGIEMVEDIVGELNLC